jgi:molecular chaperone HtpG
MTQRLTIPDQLLERLRGSSLEPGALVLVDVVTEILRDNKTPFFEAYTDHGSEHVERVLAACVRLIPPPVLDGDQFRATDAAILIGSALLHDLAMHVREDGFVELVAPGTRFRPLPWFRDRQDDRAADTPWPELWRAFQREARDFGKSQLDVLLGSSHNGLPDVGYTRHLDPTTWRDEDRLLIGEFLRRHHARLAHEIAVHGFPGGIDLIQLLPADIADAMGCVARSHGELLRSGLAYVNHKYGTDMRPARALLPFLMALLRVADYLQLDAERAPTVLLHLKDPQSPKSVEEWEKHAAVRAIGWDDRDDPAAVWLHLSPDLTLRIHLALNDLVEMLRAELDTTVAVLDEHYGAVDGYRAVQLARRRVRTNLNSPALLDALPFVPRRAALRNATDLFRLMIWDLYGAEDRGVGGRELVQNAVDAVRERRRVETSRGEALGASEFHDLGPNTDVLVTLEEQEDGSWLLRVRDRAIGMTPDTIINYFLLAGASYGSAKDHALDASDDRGVALKTGHFGIGAFATFLLGDRMTVTTRHVDEAHGVRFDARLDDDLVELHRCDAPFGTEVVVPVEVSHLDWDGDSNMLLSQIGDYYRFTDPVARSELWRNDGSVLEEQRYGQAAPRSEDDLDPRWRALTADGFDAVYWTWSTPLELVHNGIAVYDIDMRANAADWYEARADLELVPFPTLSVIDSRNRLELALHRFWVRDHRVPFERELLRAVGQDIVTYGLVHGANGHPSGLQPIVHDTAGWIPALPDLIARFCRGVLVLVVIAEAVDSQDGEFRESVARAVRRHLDGKASTLVVSDRSPDAAMRRLVQTHAHPAPVSFTDVASVSAGPTPDPLADLLAEDEQPAQARDPSVAAALRAALEDASRRPPQSRVELSAYEIVPSSPTIAPSHLAAPWLELVGGFLPYEAEARAELTDRIWRDHPETRPMIDAWRESS